MGKLPKQVCEHASFKHTTHLVCVDHLSLCTSARWCKWVLNNSSMVKLLQASRPGQLMFAMAGCQFSSAIGLCILCMASHWIDEIDESKTCLSMCFFFWHTWDTWAWIEWSYVELCGVLLQLEPQVFPKTTSEPATSNPWLSPDVSSLP